MDDQELKEIARQLRKPEGDFGIEIGIAMNKSNLLMNRFVIETMDLAENDNILEIGMGNGCFVKDIVAAGNKIQYTGADFSQLMVNECMKLNSNLIEKMRASFVLADASNLPFKDNSFNKIFTVNTIYFWDDPKAILKELRRVLTPDGYLYIVYRSKASMSKFPFTQYGFQLRNTDEVNEMIVKNDFKIIENLQKEEPVDHQNADPDLPTDTRDIIILVGAPV